MIKFHFFNLGNEADTVAYAAHCQQEASLDRPIAGHTNICPQAIVNGTKEIDALYSTIKHELLHALGFSSRYDDKEDTEHFTDFDKLDLVKFAYGVQKWHSLQEWSEETQKASSHFVVLNP